VANLASSLVRSR